MTRHTSIVLILGLICFFAYLISPGITGNSFQSYTFRDGVAAVMSIAVVPYAILGLATWFMRSNVRSAAVLLVGAYILTASSALRFYTAGVSENTQSTVIHDLLILPLPVSNLKRKPA